jgi:hypothetical protein
MLLLMKSSLLIRLAMYSTVVRMLPRIDSSCIAARHMSMTPICAIAALRQPACVPSSMMQTARQR